MNPWLEKTRVFIKLISWDKHRKGLHVFPIMTPVPLFKAEHWVNLATSPWVYLLWPYVLNIIIGFAVKSCLTPTAFTSWETPPWVEVGASPWQQQAQTYGVGGCSSNALIAVFKLIHSKSWECNGWLLGQQTWKALSLACIWTMKQHVFHEHLGWKIED